MHSNALSTNDRATLIVINRLIPFATYNITIKAATVIGFGPASMDTLATTLQAGKHVLLILYSHNR